MNDGTKPVYAIIQLEIKNLDAYLQRYGLPVLSIFDEIGAEVLAVSPAPKVLEGEWGGNWTVVIQFPSLQVFEEFYNASEYQPLKELRIHELTERGSVVVVDAFDPVALGI